MDDLSLPEAYSIPCIGYARSPFGEKFAVPRQPGLAPHILTTLHFIPPYDDPAAFRGLEGFSHIIVLFIFDRATPGKFKPMVRPPRLGGNTKVGVFATRSPFRPSRIGMSVVKLEHVRIEKGRARLEISGADLVDGTPIIDIKPYIPFADAMIGASGGFAEQIPPKLKVEFEPPAVEVLQMLKPSQIDAIREALSQDPRPAYQHDETQRVYGVRMYDFNLKFKVNDGTLWVLDAVRIGSKKAEINGGE